MRSAALVAIGASLGSCTAQDMRASTPVERAEVEAQVRACGLPVRNARWTRIEALGQWEFGFEIDPVAMGEETDRCIDRVGERLISPRRLDVMIAYSGTPAGTEGRAR